MYIKLYEFLILMLLKFLLKLIQRKLKGQDKKNLWTQGCNVYKLSLIKVKAKYNKPMVYSYN